MIFVGLLFVIVQFMAHFQVARVLRMGGKVGERQGGRKSGREERNVVKGISGSRMIFKEVSRT